MKNTIKALQLENGKWINVEEEIEKYIADSYKSLHQTEALMTLFSSVVVERRINEVLQMDLLKDFAKEVFEALDQLHLWKAPSLDGLHTGFYQNFWKIVGEDVLKMALTFLNGSIGI